MGGDGKPSEGREGGRGGASEAGRDEVGSQKEVGAVTVDGNFLFEETRVCRRFSFTQQSARSVCDIWESFPSSGHGELWGETFLHTELGGFRWNQIAAVE